jgi:hypothetical protein
MTRSFLRRIARVFLLLPLLGEQLEDPLTLGSSAPILNKMAVALDILASHEPIRVILDLTDLDARGVSP